MYSFDDVLKIFFDRTNWSGEVKRRKKYSYAKLLQSFSVFSKFFIIDKLPSLFFTERGATYFINDMILRQSYQDNDNIVNSFIHILKTPQSNKGDFSGSPRKSYENISLPKSSYLFRENDKKRSHNSKSVREEMFNYDCKRLGLNDQAQREWYYALLKKLSEVMPDVKTLFEYEIEKLSSRNNLDYRELDINSEYRLNTCWATKLFIEVSTTDKTQSPKRETKIKHDLKKTCQRFFCLHLMYHIRNASYASLLTMNLSDLFYIRHSDIDYSFNMMSHLGVTQSLKTVRNRQIEIAKARDVEEEIISFTPCTWTYLWDNFNKTHGSNSVVYGDQHTSTVEVINRAALALPPPKPCPSERCRAQCIDSCYWQKEKPPNKIDFNEIYLNQQETTAKNDFIETRSKYFLNETSKIFTQLTKILNDSHSDESIVNSLPPTSLDTDTIDENTFLRAELNIALESTKNILNRRDIIRKLSDVKNFSNSSRIILP